ncbi:MAG: RAMP superfamily CRISPR-associated protein [Clostridiales bacterium]|nr:RAMP superfamily CRISPR-associated protein [Clostridiales bacterium]
MTQYIRIQFRNVEPLKIADDNSSQTGQVNVLTYVPGTSLRGAVISAFVRNGEMEEYKTALLSDQTSFLNAYIMMDGREMIPSVKGFYEDKSDSGIQAKDIENMLVNGQITPGNKRAALGQYCYPENGCIFYGSVEMGSDMKINRGRGKDKKNVFRSQYIVPGYRFSAYIAVRDSDELCEKIQKVLERMKEEDSLILGGNRSFGYGKCRILSVERTGELPYNAYAVQKDVSDQVYMVLLSNTTMINEIGENAGVDEGILGRKLGIPGLAIQYCSTSVTEVRGYNRTWQAAIPSIKMYEPGSVFKMMFSGKSISREALETVMDEGIGVRTNEGYGRVLFFDHYEELSKKKSVEISHCDAPELQEDLDESEKATLLIAAKGYYLNLVRRAVNAYIADPKNSIRQFGLNGTQLGTIESILYSNLYSGENGFEPLLEYFKIAIEKDSKQRVQKQGKRRNDIANYIEESIIGQSLPSLLDIPESVMGLRMDQVLDPAEIVRVKQNLVIQQVKYANRGGKSNG